MLALMTVKDTPIALEPDCIESVQPGAVPETAVLRMQSGDVHVISRGYRYVTRVIQEYNRNRAVR